MTTTLAAIRDEQIAIVQALTPSDLAHVPFRVALDERDFREWAQAEPVAAFRRFAIVDRWTYTTPEADGGDVTWEPTEVDVMVAYPRDYRYGTGNSRSREDVMRADRAQIDYAIGAWGAENMSDSSATLIATRVEEYPAVAILAMTLRVFYYRSTTGATYVASQNSSEQSFRYTTTVAADSYSIAIPRAMADTSYVVAATIATLPSGGMPALRVSDSGRTTTAFTLELSGTVPIGTGFDLIVRDR